jgi:hypothetical protein
VAFIKAELPSVVVEPDQNNPAHVILVYPMAAPKGGIVATGAKEPESLEGSSSQLPPRIIDAITQLELVKLYNDHWCEHNASASIYVNDNPEEWKRVGEWVLKHIDEICGLSFFPNDCGIYPQAPFTAVTEATYQEAAAKLPRYEAVDWGRMSVYEGRAVDALVSNHRESLSCTGASCEIGSN